MIARGSRVLLIGAGATLLLWWVRLLAHSKVAAPEGRWKEVSDEELV